MSLVVISKVKEYIKNKGDMNTSKSAIDALTKLVEHECDQAIERATKAKRKTVMDRDVEICSCDPKCDCN